MANIHRGEIVATLDGIERRLRLTLGALAELEQAFGADSLADLVRRIASGSLSARQIAQIVAAGLRGAGENADADGVCTMACEDGAAGFAAIVRELIEATFGIDPDPAPGDSRAAQD